MKRIFLLTAAVILIIFMLTAPVGAAGIEKWTFFGLESEQQKPAIVETPDGILVNLAKYWYSDDDTDEETRFGAVYNDKITLDGCRIEVEVLKAPDSGDAWLGINFFNNFAAMNHTEPSATAGFITLIRPGDGELGFEGYQCTEETPFSSLGRESVEVADVTHYTAVMEAKKSADGYRFYLNGVEHQGVWDQLPALFADGTCYVQINTHWADDDHGYEVLVKSINGNPVVWEEAAPAPDPEPAADVPADAPADAPAPARPAPAAPQTGDPAAIFLIISAVSASGVLALRKKAK